MNKNLFLDDVRNPSDCALYIKDDDYVNLEWEIVRNYDKFIKFIETHGIPELISLDHDLADEHYRQSMYNQEEYDKEYATFTEKTGLDCAKWLVDYCLDKNIILPKFKVHSMNPAGKKNIYTLLLNFEKFQKENNQQ